MNLKHQTVAMFESFCICASTIETRFVFSYFFFFTVVNLHFGDFAMTSKSYHKKDFEPLFKELGPRVAEAYIEALLGTIVELDRLRDASGKIRQITEQDLITALKHNFGAEWRGVYEKILELNDNDLEASLKVWNDRGVEIQDNGYSGFLNTDFNSVFTKQLNLVKKIQLSKVIGVLGSTEDFKVFDSMLPGVLPRSFVKIIRYI